MFFFFKREEPKKSSVFFWGGMEGLAMLKQLIGQLQHLLDSYHSHHHHHHHNLSSSSSFILQPSHHTFLFQQHPRSPSSLSLSFYLSLSLSFRSILTPLCFHCFSNEVLAFLFGFCFFFWVNRVFYFWLIMFFPPSFCFYFIIIVVIFYL